jgi:ATP-binding protein involved in chromosome partitioning
MSNKNQELIKKVRSILSKVYDYESKRNLNDSVDHIVIQNNMVIFAINVINGRIKEFESYSKTIAEHIEKEFNLKAIITLTEDKKYVSSPSDRTKSIPDKVKKIIPVASGKGGVGKSTVAFNLAIALASKGYGVGIVDVDIYGPSLHRLSNIFRKPILKNNMMIPHKKFGIKLMSVGYLVDEEQALVWRGPMTTKMLHRLIMSTNWVDDGKDVDYLIVDTPPGTGDVHLSLIENYRIDGAIVVTTPQDLSIVDARKALNMFEKTNTEVLGIIENMSYYKDPCNGEYINIFGKGGTEKLAKEYNVQVLAKIPIDPEICSSSDQGKPLTYYKQGGYISKIFTELSGLITA